MQQRAALQCDRVHIRACSQQAVHHGQIATIGSAVEHCGPNAIQRIKIADLQERALVSPAPSDGQSLLQDRCSICVRQHPQFSDINALLDTTGAARCTAITHCIA